MMLGVLFNNILMMGGLFTQYIDDGRPYYYNLMRLGGRITTISMMLGGPITTI